MQNAVSSLHFQLNSDTHNEHTITFGTMLVHCWKDFPVVMGIGSSVVKDWMGDRNRSNSSIHEKHISTL